MSGKRAALPCGHRLAHPDRGLRVLLEPSSLSGKVTSNNGSAGHRDPTGGLRCPGDKLRHNELVFYAEMTGDCLQRTKPLRSSHGTPCRHHKGVITEQQASSRPLPAGARAIPSSPCSVGPAWSPAPCRGCARTRAGLQTEDYADTRPSRRTGARPSVSGGSDVRRPGVLHLISGLSWFKPLRTQTPRSQRLTLLLSSWKILSKP